MVRFNVDFSGFDSIIKEADKVIIDQTIQILTNIGERYINEGRESGTYTDRTGNLRNAHSYIINKDGDRIAGVTGRPETLQMFESMKTSIGIQLIVGDGMNYASFVEGRGYNVSTSGFMQVEREIREKFKVV